MLHGRYIVNNHLLAALQTGMERIAGKDGGMLQKIFRVSRNNEKKKRKGRKTED